MGIEIFLRGIIVGLAASVTLGPVGVMCIQRTLSKNRQSGFVSGMGAATADTIFAIIAYFFVAVISSLIDNHLQILTILGGICVVIVGVNIFLKNPVVQIRRNRAGKSNLGQDYISTFLLTLTNPAFIIYLLFFFSAFNIGAVEGEITFSKFGKGFMTLSGFLIGASAWWFLLTSVVSLLRNRFRPRHLLWINRIAGTLITGLGTATILITFIKNF